MRMLFGRNVSDTEKEMENIAEQVKRSHPLSPEKLTELHSRVSELQKLSGYQDDFMAWVKEHLPERLEDMLKK